ncbi:hypothetical protein Nepgr_032950 [Nepenthes gracilis]|uniref:Uncharacterized protein n=1 Tax=Nepenthes gracilis TaxID=150966 RepID=A0AAD3Y670_NEPGR|nr:hypothetical protein Nepgr_032950 [Nepenthes gracilis]
MFDLSTTFLGEASNTIIKNSTEDISEAPAEHAKIKEEIRATEVPNSELPCPTVQVYVEKDISSEALEKATTEDNLEISNTSFVDQVKTWAEDHFEIAESLMSVVGEAIDESEVMVEANEAKEIVEAHEAEEVAAVVDVPQMSGRLEPKVQREKELPMRSPFLKVLSLVFLDPPP